MRAHPDSSFFNRDVEGVKRFFKRRFRYEPESWPTWADVLAGDDDEEYEVEADQEAGDDADAKKSETKGEGKKRLRLDLEVEASGWKGDMQKQLEEVCPSVILYYEVLITVHGCCGRSASV